MQTQHPAPNSLIYSEHRQAFKMTGRRLVLSMNRFNDQIAESRELHFTGVPESKALKERFGSLPFRFVEHDPEPKRDGGGHVIVGGVNSYPEPLHVLLFVSSTTLVLLNQAIVRDKCAITIFPAYDLLSWDREAAVPVYEARIVTEG